jgi:phytoene synthase
VAAGRLLGAPEPDALRPLGAAYGVAGMLRSVAALAAQGRCLLPADLLGTHGLLPEAVVRNPADPALRPVLATLAAEGRGLLAQGRGVRLPRAAVAAALPAVLAQRDLRRDVPPGGVFPHGPRGFGDRMAVTLAGLTGRF